MKKTLYAVLKVQKPNKKESVTRLRVILERVFFVLKIWKIALYNLNIISVEKTPTSLGGE